jgi:hypothetical protein
MRKCAAASFPVYSEPLRMNFAPVKFSIKVNEQPRRKQRVSWIINFSHRSKTLCLKRIEGVRIKASLDF